MSNLEHPLFGTLEQVPDNGYRLLVDLGEFSQFRIRDDSEADEAAEPYPIFVLLAPTAENSISRAQEASLQFLLENEADVLSAICDEVTRHRDEWGEVYNPEEGDLVQQMEFTGIYIAASAIDGVAPMEFVGNCLWDEEHGFEITVIKNRVADYDDLLPFPCPLPESVDWKSVAAEPSGDRHIELCIHGRWTGIYRVDPKGVCTGVHSICPLCEGAAWDAEGIEAIRAPSVRHKWAVRLGPWLAGITTLLVIIVSPGLLLTAPVYWPGLFWFSLGVCATAIAALEFVRLVRLPHIVLAAMLQIVLSGAGLVAWYVFDPFHGIMLLDVVGWTIWVGAAVFAVGSLVAGCFITFGLAKSEMGAGLIMGTPFISFAIFVGVFLWLSAVGRLSQLHLLWAVPLGMVVGVITAAVATMLAARLHKPSTEA